MALQRVAYPNATLHIYTSTYAGTFDLRYPDTLTSAFRACTALSGAVTILLFALSIWILVIRHRWRHTAELRFLAMTVWTALFALTVWALTFASYLRLLLHDAVRWTWLLVPGFQSLIAAAAELLLVAAIYYILHNRLRAVGVPGKSVRVYAGVHWVLLGVLGAVLFVTQFADWGIAGVRFDTLADPEVVGSKYGYRIVDSYWFSFIQSAFVRLHARRVWAAFYVLRLVMQLEMVGVGIVILQRLKHGRNAMTVFFAGSLVTYTIPPLTMIIVLFKYWEPVIYVTSDNYPPWLYPLTTALQGFPLVICVLCICRFAVKTSRVQWQLGARSDAVRQENHDSAPGMMYAGHEGGSDRY